jgi:hypothetical protein
VAYRGAVVGDQDVLVKFLDERGMSRKPLAKRLEIDETELEDDFPIGLFVQVASLLGAPDYNELVGRISRDAWVSVQSAEVLQGLLDATEEVRVAVFPQLSPKNIAVINEAAAELAAARWAAQQNRAGVIQGLDPAVHSVDAEDFLDYLQKVECIVRAGVKPFFTPIPDHDLPAVGNRPIEGSRGGPWPQRGQMPEEGFTPRSTTQPGPTTGTDRAARGQSIPSLRGLLACCLGTALRVIIPDGARAAFDQHGFPTRSRTLTREVLGSRRSPASSE